jgi:hypothetical protein
MGECKYGQRPDACHQERCIWPISIHIISELFRRKAEVGYETHGEHTDTLQSSDIFVQVLHVCVDLMSGSNSSLEQVFGCLFLEIGAVGDVNWAVVSVQRLVDVWVSKMVSFELGQSVIGL